MESEKVKEIKKALKICTQQGNSYCHEEKTYEQCPYYEDCKKAIHENNPQSSIMEHALSLINELESENKQLLEENESLNGSWKMQLKKIAELESENERLENEKQKVLEYMKTDNYAKLKKEDMYWGYQMGIGMLEHEIDRQKDRIAELEKSNEALSFAVKQGFNDCQTKTLKQFAETFKQKCIDAGIFPAFVARKLEETLKEFIGNV